MIKVKNLNKYYNKGKSNQIHVINDTSLELPSKGLITFLGHSGSGKTTLLNVIGGLDKSSNGTIEYDEVSFNKYNMSKVDKYRSEHIGYVFQNYNLLLEETVYDNLRIALDLIGITDFEEQNKRIEYSLKAVGMFKYRKKVASFLSGGQQQRVSIARALVKKSKIIIADEPTGNLDSKNTMEVMNILKKISEQALVLLVTHENNVAEFYSDLIYEIKDGKIVDKKETNGDVTFNSNEDNSTIYLKDLNENEFKTELGNILIHSDTEEPLKINLDIIIKNGNIYLNSDKPIKLLEQSNLKIVNDNYKEMKREDISSFDYDTSWYNDTKGEKKKSKKFIKRLKNSFISFKAVGKKQKFLYICLGLIGAIMSIAFSLLTNAITFDLSTCMYSKDINYLYRNGSNYYNSFSSILGEAYQNDEIKDVYCLQYGNVIYEEQITIGYSVKEQFYAAIVPSLDYNTEMLLGDAPKNKKEIAVSNDIASTIAKKAKIDINNVINKNVKINDIEYKITGITKNTNLFVNMSLDSFEQDFNEDMFVSRDLGFISWYKYKTTTNYIIDNKEIDSIFDFMNKNYVTYEIEKGQDVDLNSDDIQALVSPSSGFVIGDSISLDINLNAKVVGYYKNYDYGGNYSIIINKDVKVSYVGMSCNFIFNDSKNIKLKEGKYPTSKNEIIIPFNLDIGSELNSNINLNGKNYKVVGKFIAGNDFCNSYFMNISDYTFLDKYASNFTYKINDDLKFNERLASNDIQNLNIYETQLISVKQSRTEFVNVFLGIFSVTVVVASLFVYFIMRSKMLTDIYNIGVYRSLGASRFRINRKYLSDILVLATFTSFIGYLLGAFSYYGITELVNGVTNSILRQAILMNNFGIMALGALALYAVLFIFGMLPIVLLQTKTPSEIIAKYDI